MSFLILKYTYENGFSPYYQLIVLFELYVAVINQPVLDDRFHVSDVDYHY